MDASSNVYPPLIKEVFEKLHDEIAWLHVKWIIYRQLFAHTEARVGLLNESTSVFLALSKSSCGMKYKHL
jgi:hypothetical protein